MHEGSTHPSPWTMIPYDTIHLSHFTGNRRPSASCMQRIFPRLGGPKASDEAMMTRRRVGRASASKEELRFALRCVACTALHAPSTPPASFAFARNTTLLWQAMCIRAYTFQLLSMCCFSSLVFFASTSPLRTTVAENEPSFLTGLIIHACRFQVLLTLHMYVVYVLLYMLKTKHTFEPERS